MQNAVKHSFAPGSFRSYLQTASLYYFALYCKDFADQKNAS